MDTNARCLDVNTKNISSKKNQPSFFVKSNRGSIYDRNGQLVATTIKVNRLNINAQERSLIHMYDPTKPY